MFFGPTRIVTPSSEIHTCDPKASACSFRRAYAKPQGCRPDQVGHRTRTRKKNAQCYAWRLTDTTRGHPCTSSHINQQTEGLSEDGVRRALHWRAPSCPRYMLSPGFRAYTRRKSHFFRSSTTSGRGLLRST